MKYRNIFPAIALTCIFFSSCNLNGPKPCFELICESMKQMDYVLAGEDVLISNCTDNGISYSWDFGDGASSTLKSPHHVWETAGTYTITMEAENEDGVKSETMDIIVEPSLYGHWNGIMYRDEYELIFTLDLVQAGYKIKGDFSPAGSYNSTGVLSSNSLVAGDSIVLDCALIYIYNFGNGESYTSSSLFKLEGTYNAALTEMGGDKVSVNDYEYDSWTATKVE